MKTQHTPGPWRIEDVKAGTLLYVVPKAQQKAFRRKPWTGDYYQIASVATSFCRPVGKSKFEHPPLPEGQALANARLIAAAPDLLDALSDCLESLSRLPNTEGAYRVTVLQQAREAIAKATKGAA